MFPAIPYVKTRNLSVVDTTLKKTRGLSNTVRKLRSYVGLPSLNLANTWRGSSEIIYRLDFDFDWSLSLLENFPLPAPIGCNYCACISWKPTSNTIVRYKLWQNVGEILYVPIYSNQRTKKSFSIEIWNTNNALITGPSVNFYTSHLIIPDDFCNDDDVNLGNGIPCVDPIFDFRDFVPNGGDYYILVEPCTRLLIKGPRLTTDYLLLKSTDDTWHKFYLIKFVDTDGNTETRGYVKQSNDAASGLGYYLFAHGGYVYKFSLQAFDDGINGVTHYPLITGPLGRPWEMNFYGSAYLLNADDGFSYRFSLTSIDGTVREQVGQIHV